MKLVIGGEAVEIPGGGGGEIYSTEETRIGTWIDGKPLYRQVLQLTTPNAMEAKVAEINETIDVKHIWGFIHFTSNDNILTTAPANACFSALFIRRDPNSIWFYNTNTTYYNKSITVTIEYTKTTGQASASALSEQNPSFTLGMRAVPVTVSAEISTEEG